MRGQVEVQPANRGVAYQRQHEGAAARKQGMARCGSRRRRRCAPALTQDYRPCASHAPLVVLIDPVQSTAACFWMWCLEAEEAAIC